MLRPALLACLLTASACAHASAVYTVDFDHGSDAAAGTAGAPFKHSPGDPEATGRAAAVHLGPGDVVRFAAGVRYRGSIIVHASGADGRPVVFESAPGGQAIIDGSDPLSDPAPCRAAADCLGAANWQHLARVAVPESAVWSDWLFAGDSLLRLAETPASADPFTYDDVRQFRQIGRGSLGDLRQGLLPLHEAVNTAGTPVLALWSRPNVIRFTPFTVSPEGLRFTLAGYVPYDDRENAYALLNAVDGLTAPGAFLVSGHDRIALVWLDKPAPLSIGTRRFGFQVNGAAHVVIRGLAFRNFSGAEHDIRSGLGVELVGSPSDDITIASNDFGPAAMVNGQGAIGVLGGTRIQVTGNRIHDIAFGSGLRAGNIEGPLIVRCNSIARVGRTGIAFLSVAKGVIADNILTDINGIHGNGISAYLDNRQVAITGNIVTGSMRPLTIHGNQGKPHFDAAVPFDLTIEGNLLAGTDPKSAALTSWGGALRNLSVTGNTVLAPATAIRFTGDETGIRVENNHLDGEIRVLHPGGGVSVGHNGGAGGRLPALEAAKRAEIAGRCPA